MCIRDRVLGVLLALVSKPAAIAVGLLGTLFVGALKAVAPVLVLMLVMASIANHCLLYTSRCV